MWSVCGVNRVHGAHTAFGRRKRVEGVCRYSLVTGFPALYSLNKPKFVVIVHNIMKRNMMMSKCLCATVIRPMCRAIHHREVPPDKRKPETVHHRTVHHRGSSIGQTETPDSSSGSSTGQTETPNSSPPDNRAGVVV